MHREGEVSEVRLFCCRPPLVRRCVPGLLRRPSAANLVWPPGSFTYCLRLILDGTVVRVRLDRKATSISLLVVIGVGEDGRRVLLAMKSMGGESTEARRSVLDDLIARPKTA